MPPAPAAVDPMVVGLPSRRHDHLRIPFQLRGAHALRTSPLLEHAFLAHIDRGAPFCCQYLQRMIKVRRRLVLPHRDRCLVNGCLVRVHHLADGCLGLPDSPRQGFRAHFHQENVGLEFIGEALCIDPLQLVILPSACTLRTGSRSDHLQPHMPSIIQLLFLGQAVLHELHMVPLVGGGLVDDARDLRISSAMARSRPT